jgi:hypothetical protein
MALLCGHAKVAWAAPACQSVTERRLDEIVVPFGDPDLPKLPPQAIKLLPGETLCLTGKVDSSGDLQELRALSTVELDTGLWIELQLRRGEQTSLLVRHSGKSYLYYDALQLVTEQDVAFPARALPVGPGMLGAETWDHGVRKLVLYGFRLGAAPQRWVPGQDRPRRRNTSRTNASVTFGFWGGERSANFDELSRALGRDAYYPLQRNNVVGGFDLDFTFGRVRVGVGLGAGGRTTYQRKTERELSTWMSEIFFTAGFDVLRFEQFHVFLGTGIGSSLFYVDRPEGSTLFPDVQPWEGDRVKFSALEMPFEIGTDYFVPFARASGSEKWLLQLGVRAGWIEQFGSGGWETDAEKKPRDLPGPAVDLSGPRARLVLGIGAQNGW